MSAVYLKMTYKLELTDDEIRLIGMALTDKLTGFGAQQAAAELHLRLVKAQNIRITEQKVRLDGLLAKAQAAVASPAPLPVDDPTPG